MRYPRKANVWVFQVIALLTVFLISACSSAAPPASPVDSEQATPRPVVGTTPEAVASTSTSEPEIVRTATSTAPPAPTPSPTLEPPAADTPVPSPTATPKPAPTPVVWLPPQGTSGGSLRVAGFAEIPHRDVHQSVQEMRTSMGPGLAYSRLLRLRTGPDIDQPSLRLECDLCQSWRMTDDLAYEFRLRPGVLWQNIPPVDARPLVADDLVFSYDRMRTPGWPNAALFAAIESIDATDDDTLRVKLASPDADVLLALADGHSKVVAREVVEQYGDLKMSPVVGTGPWIWEEPDNSASMSLVRNAGYFEEAVPYIDRLTIQVIQQSGLDRSGHQERLAAFLADLVDVVLVPPGQWPELQASGVAFKPVNARQSGTGVVLSMNVHAPPLSTVEVRRAIFKALDPWDYVDTIFGGQGYSSVGIPVQSPDWLLNRQEIRQEHFADPANGRRLLAEWSNGQPVEIELTVRTEEFGQVFLELEKRVASDLMAVGFNPRIRRLNPTQFSEAVGAQKKDYQVALGVLPPTSTTNSFLLTLLHSGGRWNITGHQDAKLDGMIERQAVELDPVGRRAQLMDIQGRVLDQAYLFSTITGGSRWAVNPRVQGFHPNTALSEYIYWSRLWLDQ